MAAEPAHNIGTDTMTEQTIVEIIVGAAVLCGVLYVYPRLWIWAREYIARAEEMRAHNAVACQRTGRKTERCACEKCQIGRTLYKINL